MPAVIEATPQGSRVRTAFNPPPVVKAFIQDPAPITGYFGPLGCAKTTALAWKVWHYARAFPGAEILVTRATWPALRDTTQKEFFAWFPPGVMGTYHETKKIWTWDLGEVKGTVLWRGLDDAADMQNVLSLNIAAAALDEPQGGIGLRKDGTTTAEPGVSVRLFEAIFGRCGRQTGFRKMLWMVGNPTDADHWIPKLFGYEPGASGCDRPSNRHPGRHLYLGTANTNRANLAANYYEDLEDLYGAGTPMARRFLQGHWLSFAGAKPFQRDWITYWGTEVEPLPDLRELRVHLGTDPAVSQKQTASTRAFVIAGQATHGLNRGRIYILRADEGRWSVYEHVDRMLKAVMAFGVRTICVEKVAYQAALGEVLEHEARLRRIPVHVELVPPDGDKIRRANAWAPRVEDGTVLFGPECAALVQAMLAVPGETMAWNLVDAAGLCMRSFPALEGESMPVPGQEVSTPAMARSYAVRPLVPAARRQVAPETQRAFSLAAVPSGMRRAAGYAVRRRIERGSEYGH